MVLLILKITINNNILLKYYHFNFILIMIIFIKFSKRIKQIVISNKNQKV